MVDVHVITNKNRCFYSSTMAEYFSLRHEIFVGERRWMSLQRADGLEIDQYDNEHSVYILAIDDGRVVGGQRLYPTLLPHMIIDHFPHLIDGVLPIGEEVYEWTRYFVVRKHRGGGVNGLLMASVQQYCLERAITTLTAVGEMWWLPRWHQYGFVVHPLGLPQPIEGQPAVAVQIAVQEDTYAHALRVAGLRSRPFKRRPDALPAADIQHAA